MTNRDYNATIGADGLSFECEIENWKAGQPIPLRRSNLDSIPPDTFDGGFLEAIVKDASLAAETPIELAGFLGLAAIATIVAKRFTVRVEPDYFEPLNIWLAAAMDPSNRKSFVLKTMVGTLVEWERQQARELAPSVEKAKSERKTYEKLIADKRKQIAKLKTQDEQEKAIEEITEMERDLPPVPVAPQLLINDCTPEKVAALLDEQGERISFLDSEADSMFAMMMGRYSDSPVLDVYLKAYSGDYCKVDRQTKAPISLSHPLMTMGIAPQPGLIQDLTKKPVLIQRGLLSRFMFALPLSKVGSRKLKPNRVSDGAKRQYEAGIENLLAIQANVNENGVEIPYTIEFSVRAYEQWKAWQKEIEPMLADDGRLADPALKYWGGKLAGNTARFAALLHIASTAPQRRPDEVEIDISIIEKAVSAARVLIDHAIAVHDLANTDSDRHQAIQILDWLGRHHKEHISVRDLHQSLKQRACFQKAQDIRAGCDVLVELGWLLPAGKEPKPGRPSEKFFVHPATHPQYSQNPNAEKMPNSFGDIEDASRENENDFDAGLVVGFSD